MRVYPTSGEKRKTKSAAGRGCSVSCPNWSTRGCTTLTLLRICNRILHFDQALACDWLPRQIKDTKSNTTAFFVIVATPLYVSVTAMWLYTPLLLLSFTPILVSLSSKPNSELPRAWKRLSIKAPMDSTVNSQKTINISSHS